MTLREMHTRMDAAEFREWMEYYNERPFGFKRQEQRHGELLSSLWALHGGKDAPKNLRDPKHWQYVGVKSTSDLGPEEEAQAMLSKIGG